ncbi:MAG: hypothetical protein Q8S24_02395 [Eubacteriales bacterium]|nr:hypothetical protein [Eubacteriales bacterium]
MIIITKDNKEYVPLLIGSIESQEPGEHITCIESGDNPGKDLFGKIAHFKIHVSEIKGFRGSYSFPLPEIFYKKQ